MRLKITKSETLDKITNEQSVEIDGLEIKLASELVVLIDAILGKLLKDE